MYHLLLVSRMAGISPLYRSTVLYNRIEATMQYDNATNMFESKVLRELRSPHQMMQEMTMRQRLLTWSRVMLLAQPGYADTSALH